MEIILSMTLGITLLLVILLIPKLNQNSATIYLLALLISMLCGTAYVILLNYFKFSPNLFGHLLNSLPTLLGVFTYLYIKQSLLLTQRCNKKCLLHFIPFVLSILFSYFETNELSLLSVILNIGLKIIVSIVYLVISLKIIQQHQVFSRNHFSNIDKIDLKWLYFIVKLGLISFVFYLIIMLLWAFDVQFIQHIDAYSNLVVLVFILPISYYGLTATSVFVQISTANLLIQPVQDIANHPIVETKNELKELVSPEKAEQIYKNLLFVIDSKKLYHNDNLMLEDVAKELNLHSKYLSYVINTKSGKTFFDLINHFRIKEFNAQALSPANKHLTLLAIAFNCGFGSKSSFNRAYKNEMGISPTEFLKTKG